MCYLQRSIMVVQWDSSDSLHPGYLSVVQADFQSLSTYKSWRRLLCIGTPTTLTERSPSQPFGGPTHRQQRPHITQTPYCGHKWASSIRLQQLTWAVNPVSWIHITLAKETFISNVNELNSAQKSSETLAKGLQRVGTPRDQMVSLIPKVPRGRELGLCAEAGRGRGAQCEVFLFERSFKQEQNGRDVNDPEVEDLDNQQIPCSPALPYRGHQIPPPPPPPTSGGPTSRGCAGDYVNLRHHGLFSASSPNTNYHACFGTFYRLKLRQMWQSRSHCSSRPCCREKPRIIKQWGRPLHSSGARRNLRAASASLPVNSLSPCCIQWSYQLFEKLSNNKVIIWIIIIITIALRLECFSWGTSTNKDIHLIKSYKSQQYISFI